MDDVDRILDWNSHAVIEAAVEASITGNPTDILVASELITKHRKKAEKKLADIIRDFKIAENERSLAICEALDDTEELANALRKRIEELKEENNDKNTTV